MRWRPQQGLGAEPLVGVRVRGKAPEGENFLACRHPKEGQICQILDILDKMLRSG